MINKKLSSTLYSLTIGRNSRPITLDMPVFQAFRTPDLGVVVQLVKFEHLLCPFFAFC